MASRRMKVVVLGGGVAGLSAAWHLAEAGAEVVLFERKDRLGGRASSFTDEKTGESIDNGPHLFMGLYRQTRKWFAKMGVQDRIPFEPHLRIPALLSNGTRTVYGSGRMLPPLDFIMSLMAFCHSLDEKLRVLSLLKVLLPLPLKLDDITIAMWFDRMKIPRAVRQYSLEPLAVSILNQEPSEASAYPFAKSLRKTMMSGRNTPGIGLARVSLDELYVEPAAGFIRDRGGRIKCGVSGTGLLISGQGRVAGVALSDGTATEADAVVSALPPWDFARLAGAYAGLADFADAVKEMTPCPALSVHLWLDTDMLDDELASLPDSVFHWVYNVGHLMSTGKIGRQHLCLLRLCASHLMGKSSAELVALALEDIKHVAGRSGRVKVLHSRVDWEQDASVAFHPGSERVRRRAIRPMPGLFLAGDWVRPGSAISFENAVLSGVNAARNVTALKSVK